MTGPAIEAMLTAVAASVKITSDPTGTRPARTLFASFGIARRASNASAADPAASNKKAPRQAPNWANRPPRIGPMMLPTPHIAESRPYERFHSRSGNTRRITANASPASNPPPRPCSPRPASSTGMLGATVATRLPAPNSPNPIQYECRGPRWAKVRLTSIEVITEAIRKLVIAQA